MAPKKKVAKKGSAWLRKPKVAEQIELSRGNLSHAARQLGVTRNGLAAFIARHPDLTEMLVDQRESIADSAENALAAAVIDRQPWAVCFALKCLGKNRGYVERQETISNQTSVNINFDELTDNELERIAAGEHPAAVLAARRSSPARKA